MRLLRLIVLFAVLFGLGAAAVSFLGGDGLFRREIAVTPEEARQAAEAERKRKDAADKSVVPPAFDVVRVEENGAVVAAGSAPPGWTVHIETQQGAIGQVTAEFDGTWVFTPEAPLPPGEHSLSLRANAPDGGREIAGDQRVAVSVSGQRRSAVVALSQDDKPTRVLQSGVMTSAAPASAEDAATAAQSVAFSAVDYQDQTETGRLSMSGVASPGARIALYLDNRFIGSAQAGSDGAWAFTLTDILGRGEHLLRADHVDMAAGEVLSRAEIRFDHSGIAARDAVAGETRAARSPDQAKSAAETAAGAATPSGRAESVAGPGSRPAGNLTGAEIASRSWEARKRQAGAAETAGTKTREPAAAPPRHAKAIVVRRGDTLWHIAKEHYGSGIRYTQIFRTNRDQIRNPHRIYPGQRFDLPQ